MMLRSWRGLPVYRANGDFYSQNYAKEIAADAVEYAETAVQQYYLSIGGSLNVVGMNQLYREKINEFMLSYGGTATLQPGSNLSVSEFGKASYGFPWPIGCL